MIRLKFYIKKMTISPFIENNFINYLLNLLYNSYDFYYIVDQLVYIIYDYWYLVIIKK